MCHEAAVVVSDHFPHLIPQGLVTKPSFTAGPSCFASRGPQPLAAYCLVRHGVGLWGCGVFWGSNHPNKPQDPACSHNSHPALTTVLRPGCPKSPGKGDSSRVCFLCSRVPGLSCSRRWSHREMGIEPSFSSSVVFSDCMHPGYCFLEISGKVRDLISEVWSQKSGRRAA